MTEAADGTAGSGSQPGASSQNPAESAAPAVDRRAGGKNPAERGWRHDLTPLQSGPVLEEEIELARLELREGAYEAARARLTEILDRPASVRGRAPRSSLGSSGRSPWAKLQWAPSDGSLKGPEGSARSLLATTLEHLGARHEALESYEKAVALFSDLPQDRLSPLERCDLGVALWGLGRNDQALGVLNEATARGGATPEAHFALGLVLAQRQELHEARRHLETALDLNPRDSDTWLSLARLLEQMADPAAAVTYAEAGNTLLDTNRPAEDVLEAADRALALGLEEPDVLALRGEALRLLGRADDALQSLARSLELDPEFLSVRVSIALVLDARGDHERALAELNHVLREQPDHPLALAVRGTVHSALGRFDEAGEDLARALDADPSLLWAYVELAEALRLANKPDQALEAVARALEGIPDDPRALGTKAAILFALRRDAEALEAAEQALVQFPDDAFALGIKGQVLAAMGDLEEAATELTRALELDGSLTGLRSDLAEALRLLGRHQEAVDAADRVLEHLPGDWRTLGTKGTALANLGFTTAALGVLDRALELKPDYLFALTIKAEILVADDRLEEATAALSKALELQPDDSYATALVVELADRGHAHGALDLLDRLASPTSATSVTARGSILRLLGRAGEAEAAFMRALELDDATAEAHAGLAMLMLDAGELDRALQMSERALELTPENARYVALRGDVLAALGRDDEALAVYDLAAANGAEGPDLQVARAQLLRKLGRDEEAVEAYQLAAARGAGGPDLLLDCADLLRKLGRDQEALEAVEGALALDPDSSDANLMQADALLALERGAEADAVLGRLISNGSGGPDLLVSVGRVLNAHGRHRQAIDVATQALEQVEDGKATEGAAREVRGGALYALDDLQAAAVDLERAVAIDPQNVDALWGLGESLRRLGRLQEAVDRLYQGLRLAPDDLGILQGAGYALIGLGRYAEAVATFRRLVAGSRTSSTLADLALAYRLADEYERAAAAADQAVDLDPTDGRARVERGQLRSEFGEYEAAIEDLQVAVAQDADDADAQSSLGWAWQNLERPTAARKAFSAAYDANPDDLWIRKGLANALLLEGEADVAAAHFEAIVDEAEQTLPGDADALWLVAWCKYQLGRLEDAVPLLRKALAARARVSNQFDLALVLLCAGEKASAAEEYQRGLSQAADAHPLPRRGYLHVARLDLTRALAARPEVDDADARAILSQLTAALQSKATPEPRATSSSA